ncbi:MAG: hypothetical protein M3350_00760 [Actinomycetota bacterium]|nr:hypothetical protein [Actinomycetota bacterium]
MKDARKIQKVEPEATQRAQRRAAGRVAEYIHELSTHAGRSGQPRQRLSIIARSS